MKVTFLKTLLLIFPFLLLTKPSFSQNINKNQIGYFYLITDLMEFRNEISESYHLTRSWVYIDKLHGTPNKVKLKKFCQNEERLLNEKIEKFNYLLDTTDISSILIIKGNLEKLIDEQTHVMKLLNTFESYDDMMICFEAMDAVEFDGKIYVLTNKLINEFEKLIQKKSYEYIDLINKQNLIFSKEPIKIKKIRRLLNLLNASAEIKQILIIRSGSKLDKKYLEKDIYEILIQKYDKYYTIKEIDDLIAFYKTKTGKKLIRVSKKMMIETLTDVLNSIKK